MRIRRIRLACYRGISEHEIAFGDDGSVSIVQGPNEVGKSSITEAIDVLFECKDDSRARRVRSLQPVDRDVATEIELDLATGPYELTYRKRYHRDRITELRVHAPAPESLTGREAHHRAREILEETVDVALWKALRIHQGMAVSQANVGQNVSLSTALDHAAGDVSEREGDENESLFEAVTEEFLRYYTPTGREKRELPDLRAAVQEAETRVAELRGRMDALEEDVARWGSLSGEVARLSEREGELAAEAQRRREELAVVEGLRERVEAARLRWQGAAGAAELARRSLRARGEEAERLARLAAELERCREDHRTLEAAQRETREELGRSEAELHVRREAEAAARRRADVARVDFQHWSDRDELEELGRRKERYDRAREEATDAQALLATSRVTTEAVDRIRDAYNQLLVTQAIVRSKQSTLRLEALTDVDVEVGGERLELPAGEVREDAITAPIELTLPGRLRVSFSPGDDLAEVRRNLDRARNEYMASCQDLGVEDLETALELLKQRQRAEAKIAERDRALSYEMGEGWTEVQEQRQAELKRRVFAYLRERGPAEPMPSDRESALEVHRSSDAQLESARTRREETAVRVEALRARLGELDQRLAATAARAGELGSEAAAARDALETARAAEPDETLARVARETEVRERELAEAHARARAELEEQGVESAGERARGAEGALAKVRGELRAAETQLTEVSTRIGLWSEEGLAERFDAAETDRLHAARELERLELRARAAALLFETLNEHREEARRRYVGPLRERVESLGRIVFVPDFAVEIDETLRVTSRTLRGRSLPYEALSTGTREQLSIITRLACAMIVAEDGSGVPVILDDVLGYSDPQRLREMGAVLSVAARHVQVIVLTSFPDRYLHVGGAQVVRL